MKSIIITGGAGFIGSHVVRRFVTRYPQYHIINLDKLTYAGNLESLRDIENCENYTFEKGDICDFELVKTIIKQHNVCGIIHLAAESHVDRSISDPFTFARTNVMGALTLLEAARQVWQNCEEGFDGKMFYNISTDEVYGTLSMDDALFSEQNNYDPHSPYSASKASADHFVRAYHDTYGMPTVISNCSNNYGPNQFPEKLIPLFIDNILNKKPLPVYGEGLNVRDWLYVEDHAAAIDLIFHSGKAGESYNVGGKNEWRNIDLVKLLIEIVDRKLGNPKDTSLNLITHITDRAGHDLRYAIDASKISRELGWNPSVDFPTGIERTVEWYLANREWIESCKSE